jgi:hypothetical protein
VRAELLRDGGAVGVSDVDEEEILRWRETYFGAELRDDVPKSLLEFTFDPAALDVEA